MNTRTFTDAADILYRPHCHPYTDGIGRSAREEARPLLPPHPWLCRRTYQVSTCLPTHTPHHNNTHIHTRKGNTILNVVSPEAWKWYFEVVGEKRCAIVDTYWQTETGGHVITPLPGKLPPDLSLCA